MNTQKISSIKIPPFDKANCTLWKKKMLLFIRMANHLYIQILKNGPFTPMVRVEETTDEDMVIPAHYAPKDASEYTEPEREKVSLDSALQLILIESLDNVMYNNIVNCDTAKHIWEKIEKLCEGTEELINDLQLHDKFYDVEEVNLKFLLTLLDHLEQKISAIRVGRDLSRITLEVLYGVLKTYELEMIQKKSLRDGQGYVIDGSSALIVNDGQTSNDEQRSQTPVISTSEKRVNDTKEHVILELDEVDEFYTLDELDELDKSMAYLARKFSNIRVKKPRIFKSKGQSFNKDSSWKGKGKYTLDSKTGYKTRSFDRSNIRCFNCDELGHFATECRKPKKAKKDKAYLELEAKYDALLKKQQGKAYIADGKSWDDSDNDEDEEVGNYALMALKQGDSSSSKSQVPTLTTTDLNNKPCANTAIGLDYEGLNNKKKRYDEDKEKKNDETTQSSISVETLKANQETKEPVKEIKAEEVKKKKKNRNGKIGINKSNNSAYVADAPRKRCENCGSMNHLTHLCKKIVSNPPEGVCKYNEATAYDPYSFCDKENAQQYMNSILSENSHSTSVKSGKGKKVIWIIDSGCSRHITGDKALLSQFEEMADPLVTFGDNSKGFTMGYGKIVSGNVVIEDVALVAGLEVNLLSVSQYAERGFQVVFNKEDCAFISKKTGEIALKGVRKV
ncbi:hypothetical protein AgCh_027877 [Apium graveolens]